MSRDSPRPGRKPRADVVRNRARVLAAARVLFSRHGVAVQMHEVAAEAGVGIGTVYRHFSSRDELIEAAAEQRFAEIEEFAQAECLTDSEGQGLIRYLRHVGEVLERDQGLTVAIESVRGFRTSAPLAEARAHLQEALARLIEQGRDAGVVRDDCVVSDAYMITGSISAVIRTGSGDWRRLLELTFEGLRPR